MEENVNIKSSRVIDEVLTVIADRVPVGDRISKPIPPRNPCDGLERSYSTIPGEFYDGCTNITYPGVKEGMYSITTSGVVCNNYSGVVIAGVITESGYIRMTLQTETGGKNFLLHRLVAYQFCDPPANFEQMYVNHINGNKTLDYANNLEWVTPVGKIQHDMEVNAGNTSFMENGRPKVNEKIVHYICQQFVAGKSNTEILKELGMNTDNPSHTLLRDIRNGDIWRRVSCNYEFSKSSKKHAYTNEEKEVIAQHIREGNTNQQVFALMQGMEYTSSTDCKTSEYKTIDSIRIKMRKNGERGI